MKLTGVSQCKTVSLIILNGQKNLKKLTHSPGWIYCLMIKMSSYNDNDSTLVITLLPPDGDRETGYFRNGHGDH